MPPDASPSTTRCSRCGATATGPFCANCGASLSGAACAACSRPLAEDARFCHHCGAAVGTARPARAVGGGRALAWLTPGIAVLAIVAFLIGQRVGGGGKQSPGAEMAAAMGSPMGGAAPGGDGTRAPDISRMSPEERAARLFDRVMQYAERGKMDSVRFFAPMAIQAFEMIGSPDAHTRYDLGMVALVSGDAARAGAEADTILAQRPTHLLGLILAMKAAGLRQDLTARAALQKRFLAAVPRERTAGVKEYEEHKADIDATMAASGRTP